MPIDQCQQIILLYRLRGHARKLVAANRKAGNRAVADIYVQIDRWLEIQMSHAMAGSQR